MVLWEKLIGLGFSNETAALSFCESVFSQLGQKAGNVESKETLWRMWSVVATNLTRVIKKVKFQLLLKLIGNLSVFILFNPKATNE